MHRENGSLKFTAENSRETDKTGDPKEGGIGLANVKRRLELLYPGKHKLEISGDEKTYTVNLTLEIRS